MSDILLNWINNEVKLSKQITNLNEDFSNGYFFGELLYKYKLLPQFNQFRNSSDKSSITKNYLLLQYKFDELKINFNENDKRDIINKKKYKAEMMLFRIREKLFSKLLLIQEIEEQEKARKEMNKIYKNVTWGIDPRKRLKSAKPKQPEMMIEENKKEQNKKIEKKPDNKMTKKKRLQSAKLPKLNNNIMNIGKNKAYMAGLESIVTNNDLTKKENRLFRETLKEIELFENIHMKNKLNIEKLEKRKHLKEEKKEKNNLESWKKNYKKIRQFDEEKKEKANQRINRLKSATQKSFNQTQQNFKTHIENFDKKLDHLGLNTKVEMVEVKKNEISSEAYMKTIIDAVKEKEKMRKQYEIRMKKINGDGNRDLYEIKENNKENITKDFLLENKQKRPQSSATTFMFYSNKNKGDSTSNEKNALTKFKNRPFTAKTDMINNQNFINNKIIRPKSSLHNNEINHFGYIDDKDLIHIEENIPLNKDSSLKDYRPKDNFDENLFFDDLDKENGIFFKNKIEKRHKEILFNRNIIKNTVYSLIDIVDMCFDYKNEHNKKLVEMEEWNKLTTNFIAGNPIIIKKEKPKPKIEEDLDTSSFNLFSPIKEKELKDFGQYELDELKNYIHLIGDKYDPEKNNLFVKKFQLGLGKIDLNNIMNPEEIELLFEEAKKAGRLVIDEEEDKTEYYNHNNHQKMRYIPSKEEEELLEPLKDKYSPNYIFTNLISESIKYSYDKDPKTFVPKDSNHSKVIEEEIAFQQQTETEGSLKKNIIIESDRNGVSKISEENKNENIKTHSEEEKKVDMKELIESIPIRISFLGVQKTEKKTRAKNMETKYQGLKVYHIKELQKLLKEKSKEINDENIIELLMNKIREDFQYKNLEDIKQEINKKREEIKNLNNELEKFKEEQEKKGKFNVTKDMQNIQQQIDKINNDSIKGFILIGIPENISQLKLIEKTIMDFTQPCDQEISPFEIIHEKLTLICDKPPKENTFEKNFVLSLNKIIHFESNKEVIFKKIDNRKKDPVKGDIYQMDLFPPKDKKLLARLEDIIHPTHEEIESDILKDKTEYDLIEDFYSNLDVKCVNFKGYIINENLNEITNYKNYMQLLEQNALELDNQIEKEIKDTLDLYEEKIIGPINENAALLDEIDNININESSANKEKKESELSQIPENINQANVNSNSNDNKNIQKQISKKDSFNSSMTFVKEISRINSNNNINITQNELSTSQANIFPPLSLSEVELFKSFQIWQKFISYYTNQYYKIFNKEKKTGQKYIQRLNEIQKDFIDFLSRPSKKRIIINQFLNKYMEFSKKCKSLEIPDLARERYLKDINELSETLWKIIEIRKNESIEKIKSLSSLIDHELNICYNTIEKMAILETQRFIEIINIILRFFSKNKTYQVNTPNTQTYSFILDNISDEILRKCENCQLAVYNSKTNKYIYPKANQIYKNCLRILIKLNYYLNKNIFKFERLKSTHQIKTRATKKHKIKKQKKILSKQSTIKSNVLGNSKLVDIQNKLKLSIKAEIDKYKYISYNLYINSLETLSKIFCASKLVFKLMDNWVIDSILYQNNALTALFNNLKSISIKEIIQDSNLLNEDKILKIELDDFRERYELFNYKEFLFDGKTDKKKFLTAKEINEKEFGINIEKILKIFTNWGSTNNTIDNNLGEIIALIKNSEIQKGIITRNSFEKIFFINKIIDNTNKILFPDFFYNFDFHNINIFLSHFVNHITNDNEPEKEKENEENEEENEEEEKESTINKNKDKKYQELIHSNDILTILFLICFEVINNDEIDNMKKQNENKLINDKYMNKGDFINIKFWFEEKIVKAFKNYNEINSKFKLFLFELNENKNGFINFVHFSDLISLKSLNFKKDHNPNEIKYYFDLFYH